MLIFFQLILLFVVGNSSLLKGVHGDRPYHISEFFPPEIPYEKSNSPFSVASSLGLTESFDGLSLASSPTGEFKVVSFSSSNPAFNLLVNKYLQCNADEFIEKKDFLFRQLYLLSKSGNKKVHDDCVQLFFDLLKYLKATDKVSPEFEKRVNLLQYEVYLLHENLSISDELKASYARIVLSYANLIQDITLKCRAHVLLSKYGSSFELTQAFNYIWGDITPENSGYGSLLQKYELLIQSINNEFNALPLEQKKRCKMARINWLMRFLDTHAKLPIYQTFLNNEQIYLGRSIILRHTASL